MVDGTEQPRKLTAAEIAEKAEAIARSLEGLRQSDAGEIAWEVGALIRQSNGDPVVRIVPKDAAE